jgi:hypothetical protein
LEDEDEDGGQGSKGFSNLGIQGRMWEPQGPLLQLQRFHHEAPQEALPPQIYGIHHVYIIIADFKLFVHIVLEVMGALVSTNASGRNSDSSGGVNCIQYVVTYIIMVATFAKTGENNVLGKMMCF